MGQQVGHRPGAFAEQLRCTLLAAVLSLSELANRIHFSKGLPRQDRDSTLASRIDLVRRCGAAVDAGGNLAGLAEQADRGRLYSATIRFDLRGIARTLARWLSYRAVRELQPRLTVALHAPLR